MPKHERPGYTRLEVFLPPELVAAMDKAAGPRNRTAWLARVIADATGYKLPELPGPGRPPKAKCDDPPKPKGRKK